MQLAHDPLKRLYQRLPVALTTAIVQLDRVDRRPPLFNLADGRCYSAGRHLRMMPIL
jgi:hypothetical protein